MIAIIVAIIVLNLLRPAANCWHFRSRRARALIEGSKIEMVESETRMSDR